jgi:glycosyl transferase family 25
VDEKSYVNFFKMRPEPGTIGCSLSHEQAWKHFLQSDNEFAVIFEDDVQFDPQQLSQIIQELVKRRHAWDVVGFELNHNGCPLEIEKLSDNHSLVIYLTNVKHAGAYIISRKAAILMLEKMYPIKMPLDHFYTRSWELGLRFYGIEPRLVEQKFGDSQIKTQKISNKINSPKVLLINAIYNIHTSMMQFTYGICCYLLCIIRTKTTRPNQ